MSNRPVTDYATSVLSAQGWSTREISYVDAFGECRITKYRFYYTGTGADVGSKVGLTYLDEGNTEVPCPKTK